MKRIFKYHQDKAVGVLDAALLQPVLDDIQRKLSMFDDEGEEAAEDVQDE